MVQCVLLLCLQIQLLEFEPRAAEQVPLLLKLKQNDLALKKAIASGDPDLVYTVLLHLKEDSQMDQAQFIMAVRTVPAAYSLYLQLCRQQNRSLLRDLYEQEDNFAEEAACRVFDSFQEDVSDEDSSVL